MDLSILCLRFEVGYECSAKQCWIRFREGTSINSKQLHPWDNTQQSLSAGYWSLFPGTSDPRWRPSFFCLLQLACLQLSLPARSHGHGVARSTVLVHASVRICEEQSQHTTLAALLSCLLPLQDKEIDQRLRLRLALERALADIDSARTCKTCWKYFGVISKHMRMYSDVPVSLLDAWSAVLREL